MSKPLFSAAALLLIAGCSAPDSTPQPQPPAAQSPATTVAPDAAGVNKVLDPENFTDARVRKAYAAAKQYAHVLESIYCYCRCKENIGHRALIECFESDHASHCDVCMTEAETAARLSAEGKSPQEIQKLIDAVYAG